MLESSCTPSPHWVRRLELNPGSRTSQGVQGISGGRIYRLMDLRTESRFKHLMFSRMVECRPAPPCKCCSSHRTTTWLLSHR